MKFEKEFLIKDGRKLLIRHAEEKDAPEVLRSFLLTHGETDFLKTYPEESTMTAEDEARFLRRVEEDARSAELIAVLDGRVVGCAGISPVGTCLKLRHRADLGISVEMTYWRLGIGRALMECCLECAASAGYLQVELEVVGENTAAVGLYQKMGFREYGRHPMGFRRKDGQWQTLVYMRRPLCEEQ